MDALQLFEKLAEDTWHRVTDAHVLGTKIGEETLTDMIALDMYRAAVPNVTIEAYTKQKEAKIGADFSLWIGSAKCGWIHYLVQAKVLNLPAQTYRSLKYLVGKKPKKVLQIDLLERAATASNAVPIYCLYNGGVSLPPTWPGVPVEQFGCSVASTNMTRAAIDKVSNNTFALLHSVQTTFPWRYLVEQHCAWALAHGSAGLKIFPPWLPLSWPAVQAAPPTSVLAAIQRRVGADRMRDDLPIARYLVRVDIGDLVVVEASNRSNQR